MKEKVIFLVQHGEAVDKKVNVERPLTDLGRKTIFQMGSFLVSRNIKIDAIWHSPKLRARETAEILASCLKLEKLLYSYKELEPEEPVKKTVRLIQQVEEQSIMLVGHLPHLSQLAGLLLTGDEK
ncbi:MAG: phosphohistidine phosphatase SixA, partial [Candidatus Hydrogenedens sp.]